MPAFQCLLPLTDTNRSLPLSGKSHRLPGLLEPLDNDKDRVTCGSAKPRAMSSFSMSACPPHNSGAHLWALLIDGPRKRLCDRQWISTDVKVAVPGTDHGMRRSEELAVIRAVEECCNCKEIVSHKAF